MKTRIFTLAAAVLFALNIAAKPAYRGGIDKVQPDGSVITIYQHGDEFFHYTTMEDGTWVERQADGFYKAIPALSEEQITVRRQQSPRLRKTEQVQQASPLNIAPKGLVVLVNFSDTKMQTGNTRDVFYRMHNASDYKDNGAYGSVRQYFIDQSKGKYQPQFDVVGPVTLSNTMKYYGGNVYNDYYQSEEDDMARIAEMVQEASKLADALGVDFSQYDHNKDGFVDFIYFIYAGYGEADSGIDDAIWPHMYWLHDGNGITLELDDKKINTYACGSELNYETKKRDGIATFCHEFSHVLGLPDMYTTNGAGHKTLGMWDILDYGPYNDNGNTPPSYSAYERFFLGWLEPTVLDTIAATITIPELQGSNAAGLIAEDAVHNLKGNDPDPTTFFLLENRQQIGWDEFLPGHGMLVTKVRYNYRLWYQNGVNNMPARMGVDIIEADKNAPSYTGYLDGYFGKLGDAFPHGATEYAPFEHYALTNIVEEDDLITFDLNGGGTSTNLKDPNAVSDVVLGEEEVIAIYNLLGQRQHTNDINELTSGIYIVKTTHTTKKISIR